jgi:tetratricopeptide (TPR) repeat protein
MKLEQNPTLKQLDFFIKAGETARARTQLVALRAIEIERSDLVEFADLARRVQMPSLIIRWLRPVVRPEKPIFPIASDKEIAIYALALARLGVFKESLTLLKSLLSGREPQVYFYLGLVYLEQWDYLSAQTYFQKYARFNSISDYQKTVGLLNLAACLVGERNWPKADEALDNLLLLTNHPSLKLLRLNTLELAAQSKIFRSQILEAQVFLNEARQLSGTTNHQYEFFVRKWLAIASLLGPDQDPQAILAIRDEAKRDSYVETIRECDFFIATARKDDHGFLKVLFGTHFKTYKKRILKLYGWNKPIPTKYIIELGGASFNAKCFSPEEINLPRRVRQLLRLLLSDCYRPFSLAEIFSEVYQNEYFNPVTSIPKVDQLIYRLRQALAAKQIPLDVQVKKSRANLLALAPIQIVLRRKHLNISTKLIACMNQLSLAFQTNRFTTKEAAKILKLSETSMRRHLRLASQRGYLVRQSSHHGFIYKLKKIGLPI